MELIIGLIAVFIIYFLFSGEKNKSPTTKSASISKQDKKLNENTEWMENRWNLAQKEQGSGKLLSVPQWFFDDITKGQLQKIDEISLNIESELLTKGKASDIIGLFERAEDNNVEILRFFKIPLKGMNQSKARYEVFKIFNDCEKSERWKNRPASPMQKEFYKFFDLKVPKGLTLQDAVKNILEYRNGLIEVGNNKIEEWNTYEDIFEEINDSEFREDYDLKKISLSLYRAAIDQLKKEGNDLSELSDDYDLVIDKIIEIKPEIQK